MNTKYLSAALAAAFVTWGAGAASAAVIGPFPDTTNPGGNVCPAGDLSGCVLNIDLDDDGDLDPTPAIIKFNLSDVLSDAVDFDQINSQFGSVTGGEFTFGNFVVKDNNPNEVVKLDFTYTLGTGDPGITAVAVKAGTGYTVSTDFTFDAGVFTGTLFGVGCSSTVLSGSSCKAVSNLVFFDTAVPPSGVIPLPASALLLLGGIGGFGALRSFRRKTA